MVNCAPPPFYKHRVDAPLQARCQDRPREEAEQRRDVTRRGLPAVAPRCCAFVVGWEWACDVGGCFGVEVG